MNTVDIEIQNVQFQIQETMRKLEDLNRQLGLLQHKKLIESTQHGTPQLLQE